jgi:hypothetical protein
VVGHLVEIRKIAIRVHIAESRAHRLVDEEQVRKFVPRAVVIFQVATWAYSVWSNLHHCAVHRGAAGPAIQPQYCPLSVRNVAVLVVPEEEIAVVLCINFDVSVTRG